MRSKTLTPPAATAAPAPAPLTQNLLIPSEVRARLRVCDTTLRQLAHDGLLVPLRIRNKSRRYTQASVDAYLASIAADAASA